MNESITISIFVRAFNVEKYLPSCIESILNQSYRNIQLILSDDAATDSSREICEEYQAKDDRVLFIPTDVNTGLLQNVLALNYSDSIKGSYIMFVDGDDWIEPNTVETVVELIERENADITVFDWAENEDGPSVHPIKEAKHYDRKSAMYELYKDVNLQSYNCGKVIRTDLFVKGVASSPMDRNVYDDFVLMPHIFMLSESVYVHPVVLYHYRQDQDSNFTHDKAARLHWKLTKSWFYRVDFAMDSDFFDWIDSDELCSGAFAIGLGAWRDCLTSRFIKEAKEVRKLMKKHKTCLKYAKRLPKIKKIILAFLLI